VKYLDAKRRLIFMMATVKYIRLLFKNEITITDDEIKLIVAKSLPLIFKDYTIRVEDVNEIVEGIKSCVLRINNSLNISKFIDDTTMETIRRDVIHIDEIIGISDLARLVTLTSELLHSAEEVIKTSSAFRLVTSKLQGITNNDVPIELNNAVKALVQQSIPLIFEEEFINSNSTNIIVEGIKSLILKSTEITKTDYDTVFEVIRRNSIKIDSLITVKEDIVNLITALHNLIYSNNIIKSVDKNIVTTPLSTVINIDSNSSLNNYLNIITRLSVKFVCKGEDLTSDKLLIENTVKSVCIAFKNEILKTSSEIVLDLIVSHIGYLVIKENIEIDDMINLIKAKGINYNIKENINVMDYNKLRDSLSKLIKTDSKIKSLDVNLFLALYSDLIQTNELILTSCGINLNALNSDILKMDYAIKVNNDVVLTLGDFISLPFIISTKLFINNKLFLDIGNANNVGIRSLVNTKDNNVIRVDESKPLIDKINKVDVEEYLQLLKYRYSLLKDWESTEMDDILNLDMSEFIYVLK